ncbi:hypothetical protein BgiMline_022059, partial [Biomphalaria glabrata]
KCTLLTQNLKKTNKLMRMLSRHLRIPDLILLDASLMSLDAKSGSVLWTVRNGESFEGRKVETERG